jgi:hypothetical protein
MNSFTWASSPNGLSFHHEQSWVKGGFFSVDRSPGVWELRVLWMQRCGR